MLHREFSNQLQESTLLKDNGVNRSSECAQLKHLLETEKSLRSKAQEDLNAARAENKDLISRSADMRALASSVEELKDHCSKLKVWARVA